MTGGSLRILVVDDNPLTVESEALLLGLMGHEVLAAAGGHDALAKAQSFDPDVIFLDISMPDMSGWDVARQIRAIPWTRRRPLLVALTALSGEEACERSWQLGIDFHFTKPADVQRIANMLPVMVRRVERKPHVAPPRLGASLDRSGPYS